MKDIIIKPVHNNFVESMPDVHFCFKTGVLQMTGQSFMDNSTEFFFPLFKWVEEYSTKSDKNVHLIIKLTYYNTSSAKNLIMLLEILEEKLPNKYKVDWYYTQIDIDSKEDVEEMANDLDISVNFIDFEL